MVNYSAPLDDVFVALANPVRRGILTRLAQGWATVGELSEPFDISAPAISKHLRILERAGLVTRSKRGREHYLHLVADPIKEASEWMAFYEKYWTEQFESLAEFLEREEQR